jgi:hypothetical protein
VYSKGFFFVSNPICPLCFDPYTEYYILIVCTFVLGLCIVLPNLDPADNRLVGPTTWARELCPRARITRFGSRGQPTCWAHELGPRAGPTSWASWTSWAHELGPRARAHKPGQPDWIAQTTDWAQEPSPRARAHEPGQTDLDRANNRLGIRAEPASPGPRARVLGSPGLSYDNPRD